MRARRRWRIVGDALREWRLTTVTVVKTGKDQHRGASAAPKWNRLFRVAPFPMCREAIGIFVGLKVLVPRDKMSYLNKSRVEQRGQIS